MVANYEFSNVFCFKFPSAITNLIKNINNNRQEKKKKLIVIMINNNYNRLFKKIMLY